MGKTEEFKELVQNNITRMAEDRELKDLTRNWVNDSIKHQYSYNFSWLDRPIIQYPQDMVAMQELVWKVKPDLIIELGIAHGGSLILSASLLALLDLCDAVEAGETLNPGSSRRKVLGIDIDIRSHNRTAIQEHPMSYKIDMIEGSSIDSTVIDQVHRYAENHERVLICMDSNHTHEHVLAELEAYAPVTSTGSYCVVFDTVIEDLPDESFPDRPWGKGNNPKTAVWEYLKTHPEFEVDKTLENKLLITVAPDGFLKRMF